MSHEINPINEIQKNNDKIDDIHKDVDFRWYPTIFDNPLIYFKGSKFICTSDKSKLTDYFYCDSKQCNSSITLYKDEKNEIIGSIGKISCNHETVEKIELDTRQLTKNIIHKNDLTTGNCKIKYEEELKEMVEITGNGASYSKLKQNLYNSIPKDKRVPTSPEDFINALHSSTDLINDKWITKKIDDKNILFYTQSGLDRIKDCNFLGIDGNHKSVPKLKGNKDIWSQLVTFIPVYVDYHFFLLLGFF